MEFVAQIQCSIIHRDNMSIMSDPEKLAAFANLELEIKTMLEKWTDDTGYTVNVSMEFSESKDSS